MGIALSQFILQSGLAATNIINGVVGLESDSNYHNVVDHFSYRVFQKGHDENNPYYKTYISLYRFRAEHELKLMMLCVALGIATFFGHKRAPLIGIILYSFQVTLGFFSYLCVTGFNLERLCAGITFYALQIGGYLLLQSLYCAREKRENSGRKLQDLIDEKEKRQQAAKGQQAKKPKKGKKVKRQ